MDGTSGLAIAAAGRYDLVDQHEDAAATTDIVRSVLGCAALATGSADTEILVCGTHAFHLLNPLSGEFAGRLFVHVLFDGDTGNLAMARFRLRGILAEFAADDHER
ncbi:hypothetical protein F5X71_15525 [Nocardia brasiliensis]|uniref:Roadblock/LAMTOR2 domain-containing protein n=1 Tax=Nocardia brasiliensis TaxID=37326 RepID=A0A6G9Y2Z4_NOCBR|nr:hypothetical protein F5X71_15525 [Nocardia brasiliensis]